MKRINLFILVLCVIVFAACSGKGKNDGGKSSADAVVASDNFTGPLDSLTFMIHWTPQAQFAGYYMALEKGFYKEEGIGLNLINPLHASEGDALKNLLSGKVDICTSLLQHAILEKSWGSDIVDIMQVSQNTGLMLVSHKPIKDIKELENMKIGRWKQGFGEIADFFYYDKGLDVKPVDFIQGGNLYLCGALDATLCYSYNEYIEILFAEGSADKSYTMKFSELGYNFPEDAIFTTSSYYDKNKDLIERFKRATVKGWNYARENREETVKLIVSEMRKNDIPANAKFQGMMLDEILKLQVNKSTAEADYAPITEETFNYMKRFLMTMGYLAEDIDYKEFIR